MKWTALIFASLAYVALGAGGSAYRHMRMRYPSAAEDDPVSCGAHSYDADGNGIDATPNKIRKCYYTDCFNSNKYLGAAFPHGTKKGDRRRLGGYKIPYAPNCRVGKQYKDGKVISLANKNETVKQWKFWDTKASPLKANADGACGKGWKVALRAGEDRYEVTPPQDGHFNCLFEEPPLECQCRTIFCIVEQNEEKKAGVSMEELKENSCNFMVRIEAAHWGPSLAKYTMWVIFGFSALTGLLTTAYFYVKYGGELVKEGEGSEKGSN